MAQLSSGRRQQGCPRSSTGCEKGEALALWRPGGGRGDTSYPGMLPLNGSTLNPNPLLQSCFQNRAGDFDILHALQQVPGASRVHSGCSVVESEDYRVGRVALTGLGFPSFLTRGAEALELAAGGDDPLGLTGACNLLGTVGSSRELSSA